MTFASLLRSARREAELSQAELAEAAHISLSAIGAYERGIRTKPHPETVALLANALGLTGSARTAFEDAARGRSRGNASSDRYPRSLTVANTAFVGRSADVANITASLGEHRVVTLTGPGGIGKTRLATHVAAQFVEQRDAVVFIELAALTDGTQAVHSIASLLGIPPSRKGDALGRVIDDLRSRDALLVLDNCEHIIESIATMAAALSRECPRLTILATSRERVRIGGEAVYVVPPLGADAAVELFASRAAAVDGAFRLDETTAPLVAEVCRRLDGVPLAIELAVSHVPSLGLRGLAQRLDHVFDGLVDGNRDLPARHQSLRATLQWSFDLLTTQEQVALRRLGSFSAGWSFEGAEFVCAYGTLSKVAARKALTRLVEQSLVAPDTMQTQRYRMLEIVRAFAIEKAFEAGETETNGRRHAEWMAQLADRAYQEASFLARDAWFQRYAPELDDARAALQWSMSHREAALVARIAAGFRAVWVDRGQLDALRAAIETTLAMVDEVAEPRTAATLLLSLSNLLLGSARVEAAQRAVKIFEDLGDATEVALAQTRCAVGYREIGDDALAGEALERAIATLKCGSLVRSRVMVDAHLERAQSDLMASEMDAATREMSRAVTLAAELADDYLLGRAQITMAELHFRNGDSPGAIEWSGRAIALMRNDGRFTQNGLVNRSCYRLAAGDIDGAYDDAVDAFGQRSYHPYLTAYAIQHLATVAAMRGQHIRGATLLGFVDALLSRAGAARTYTEQRGYELLIGALREELTDAEIARYAAEGEHLPAARAIEFAK